MYMHSCSDHSTRVHLIQRNTSSLQHNGMQIRSDKTYSYASAVTSNMSQLPTMGTVSTQPTKIAEVHNVRTGRKLSLSLHKPRPLSQHNRQMTSNRSPPSQQSSKPSCSKSIQTKILNVTAKQNNLTCFNPTPQQQAHCSPPIPITKIEKDEKVSHVGIPSKSAITCSQAPLSAR